MRRLSAAGVGLAVLLLILDRASVYQPDEFLWIPMGVVAACCCATYAVFLILDSRAAFREQDNQHPPE